MFPFIADIDECREGNGGCEQRCVNFIGSYSCTCYHGYSLNADGRSCDLAGEEDCPVTVKDWLDLAVCVCVWCSVGERALLPMLCGLPMQEAVQPVCWGAPTPVWETAASADRASSWLPTIERA